VTFPISRTLTVLPGKPLEFLRPVKRSKTHVVFRAQPFWSPTHPLPICYFTSFLHYFRVQCTHTSLLENTNHEDSAGHGPPSLSLAIITPCATPRAQQSLERDLRLPRHFELRILPSFKSTALINSYTSTYYLSNPPVSLAHVQL